MKFDDFIRDLQEPYIIEEIVRQMPEAQSLLLKSLKTSSESLNWK